MQEIAREAGVNQALLHYYFRSKAKLAEAVFQRVARGLIIPVFGVLAADMPLDEKITRVVQLELDTLSASPLLPGYLISELSHDPDRAPQFIAAILGEMPQAVRPRVVGALERQINAEVRAGRMRPIAPEQFAINLMSLCIFPFAARPMIKALLGIDDTAFARLIRRRRAELPAFFLGALKP